MEPEGRGVYRSIVCSADWKVNTPKCVSSEITIILQDYVQNIANTQ